jgi:hypothetical protein
MQHVCRKEKDGSSDWGDDAAFQSVLQSPELEAERKPPLLAFEQVRVYLWVILSFKVSGGLF